MDELALKFREWVFSSLSTPEPFLNNIPICPYAKEALLSERFKLATCNADLERFLRSEIAEFIVSPKEAAVFVDPAQCSVEEFEETVLKLREEYYADDVWILYDHPSLPEVQGNLKFNFDASPIIFIQRLSKLVEAARELKKRGYYKNWSKDYEEQVVSLREKFYERMLEHRRTHSHPRVESDDKVVLRAKL